MGLVAGRDDQRAALDFGEALALEMGPECALLIAAPLEQQGPAVGMGLRASTRAFAVL